VVTRDELRRSVVNSLTLVDRAVGKAGELQVAVVEPGDSGDAQRRLDRYDGVSDAGGEDGRNTLWYNCRDVLLKSQLRIQPHPEVTHHADGLDGVRINGDERV
jgi:hypothetical protein